MNTMVTRRARAAIGCMGACLMALAKQVFPVFLRGLDQKSPKHVGVIGSLDALFNMYAVKGGERGYEFQPRPGGASLSRSIDAGSILTGMRLATLGASLVLFTGSACARRAIDEWHIGGFNVPTMGVSTSPVVANSLQTQSCDTIYLNGYTVSVALVYADPVNNQVQMVVTDANGSVVQARPLERSANQSVRIVASGTTAVIFWQTPTSIRAAKFDSTTPTAVPAPMNIDVAVSGGSIYDVQTVPASGSIAVLWADSATNQITQAFLNPTTMVVSGKTLYPTLVNHTAFAYMTNDFSTNVLYVGHVSAAGLRRSTFNGATLALVVTTVFDAAVVAANNITGNRTGAVESIYVTTGTSPVYDWRIKVSSGGAVSNLALGLTLASRVLSANGTLYALVRYLGPAQGTFFLYDLVAGVAVAKALPDIASTGVTAFAQLPNLVVANSANKWLSIGLKNLSVTSAAGVLTAYVGASTMLFTNLDASIGRPVELNGALLVPGAMPYLYDGQTIVEAGFPIAPEKADAPVLAGGGVLTPSRAYTYRFVYAWTDATGTVHRSAPSAPQTVTAAALGANTKITWAIPTLRLSRKVGVWIEVERTLGDGDGSTYYLATTTTTPLLNDPTVDRVSFFDTFSDLAIVGNEPLYTDGNILENIAPPPCKAMAVHRGRMLVGGVDGDPSAIWFSKDVVPGFGVAFNDGLVSRLSTPEAVTAVGSMDTYALACTPTTTWASGDEYPDDTGNGGVLRFNRYSSSVGCASAGLMAATDQGTTVWAGKKVAGPWRLSRGLTYDYVGAAAEDDANTSFAPTALVAVPGMNQVRATSTGGNVLTYETIFGTWAKWQYINLSIVDAVVWNGNAAYLSSDGTVFIEDTTTLDDDGVANAHSLTLSDFNFAGIGGYQRIYVGQITGRVIGLGAAVNLVVMQTPDAISMPSKAIAVSGRFSEEFDPGPNGKCSTYQLQISDATGGPSTGVAIEAVTMLIGLKSGLNRLPPAQRMT